MQIKSAWIHLDFTYPAGIKITANSDRFLENTYAFQSAPTNYGLRNKRLLFKIAQKQFF